MEERVIYLKYVGLGSWMPDVPARDLTKEEAEYHGVGRLVDSKLYELVDKKEKVKTFSDVYEKKEEIKQKKQGDKS